MHNLFTFRVFALLVLAFGLAACLPAAAPPATAPSAIPPSPVRPIPGTAAPAPLALKRLDPVLYTYWISGPEILELASEVNVIDLATGHEALLFKAPEASAALRIRNVISAAWSPDGLQVLISFTNYSGSGGTLRVIGADGTARTMMPAGDALRLEYALWAPDGKHLVLRRQTSRQACLMIAGADGSDLRELPYCDALEYPRFWSTDGEWLATYRLAAANTTSGNWFADEVAGTRHLPLEQLPGVAWFDQRYYPWRIIQQPTCTWPTNPQSAKQFSYWRCS